MTQEDSPFILDWPNVVGGGFLRSEGYAKVEQSFDSVVRFSKILPIGG